MSSYIPNIKAPGIMVSDKKIFPCFPYISKNNGKNQESILSSTTPDPGYQWEKDKITITHHKREPRGQTFPSR